MPFSPLLLVLCRFILIFSNFLRAFGTNNDSAIFSLKEAFLSNFVQNSRLQQSDKKGFKWMSVLFKRQLFNDQKFFGDKKVTKKIRKPISKFFVVQKFILRLKLLRNFVFQQKIKNEFLLLEVFFLKRLLKNCRSYEKYKGLT